MNILFMLVAAVVIAGGSFLYGQRVQEAEDKAAQVDAVNQAIVDYDAITEQNKQLAVRQAADRAYAAGIAANLKGAGDEAIRAQPLAANCDWSTGSFSVLLDAVKAANPAPAGKPSVPNPVRSTAAATVPKR